MPRGKAIALISGGLDSILAARVIKDQGIDVLGVCFVMQFASRDLEQFRERVSTASGEAGLEVEFVDISRQFLDMMVSPRHGYGANINPCIDCKILMLSNAKKMMADKGASFVITGEVLGERPMSQRRAALDIIEKGADLKGRLLRPLSARLMRETLAESEGMVDRTALYDISGRSRTPQLAMAAKYGLKQFFSPAGGCLLTDPIFSGKLMDLIRTGSLDEGNIRLLKYGRHFRLDDKTKAVVGRDARENGILRSLMGPEDRLLRMKGLPGPDVFLRGDTSGENIAKAAALAAAYLTKKTAGDILVSVWSGRNRLKIVKAEPAQQGFMDETRIKAYAE